MGFPQEYYFKEGCFISEWHNTASDPMVSVARARVPKGTRTRPHQLRATTERYLILSGSGTAHIGAEIISVTAGDSVVIPPDVTQSVTADETEDLVFLAICTPRFEPENYQVSEQLTV